MMNQNQILLDRIKPMIFRLYNANESVKASKVSVTTNNYIKSFDGINYPNLDYTFHLDNGNVITKKELAFEYNSIIESMVRHVYDKSHNTIPKV